MFINQKGIVHILVVIILLVGLLATIYLSQKTQIFKPRAYEANQANQVITLTNQLLQAKERYDNVSSADGREPNPDEMIRIAKERKSKLLEEARENPQAFLEHATLADERNNYPQTVQEQIEQRIDKQGKFIVIHVDNFQDNGSSYLYKLKTPEKKYNLQFTKNAPNLLTGSIVSVKGINLDSEIVTAPGEGIFALDVISSNSPDQFRNLRVAVLTANYTDRPDALKIDDIKHYFSGQNDSVYSYYKENSLGQLAFTADYFGPYIIPEPTPLSSGGSNCPLDNISATLDSTANINLSNYHSIIYVLPFIPGKTNCASAGEVGRSGGPGRAWIFYPNSSVLAHEIGHTLGALHANSLLCSTPNNYSNCNQREYGDPYSVMGRNLQGLGLPHFTSPHKIMAGWINPSNVRIIRSSGIYTLSPLEESSQNIQVLKIPKSHDETGLYYYVSYRRPIGFDDRLLDGITRGVSIHLGNEAGTRSDLIDTTPGTNPTFGNLMGDFLDSALSDGERFYDAVSNIEVKQLNHDANSVTVEITYNSTPIPEFTNLSADISSTQATFRFNYSGTSTQFSIDISDNPRFETGTLVNSRNFTIGNSSPIVARLNNPELCGITIYWRISNRDRSVQSSVQSTIVNCGATLSPEYPCAGTSDSKTCPAGYKCSVKESKNREAAPAGYCVPDLSSPNP